MTKSRQAPPEGSLLRKACTQLLLHESEVGIHYPGKSSPSSASKHCPHVNASQRGLVLEYSSLSTNLTLIDKARKKKAECHSNYQANQCLLQRPSAHMPTNTSRRTATSTSKMCHSGSIPAFPKIVSTLLATSDSVLPYMSKKI